MEIAFNPVGTENDHLIYVVLVSRYQKQWVVVRHKQRSTWEVPGGHIEPGETPDMAAARELFEETGALKFTVNPVADYSVTKEDGIKGWGRLYFCDVTELGPLEPSEIAEVMLVSELPENLTYKDIQPTLLAYVERTL